MTKTVLAVGLVLATGGGCVVHGHPAPPRAPLAFGYWLDADRGTVVTLRWPWTAAQLAAARVRKQRVIVWTPLIGYGRTARGTEGYYYNAAGAPDFWWAVSTILNGYREILEAVYLVDEPETVAWGEPPYNPNLYTRDIELAIQAVRRVLPDTPIMLNFASLPAGLVVPAGVTWVALETYQADPSIEVARLEAIWPGGIWLMPRAFVDLTTPQLTISGQLLTSCIDCLAGGEAQSDAEVTRRLAGVEALAARDPRVIGLYPFLWCLATVPAADCDAPSFWTVGGRRLPQAQAAFRALEDRLTKGAS